MLKKMRWRFISAAMMAFSVVVAALLCIINIWNYKDVTNRQDEIIQTIIDIENSSPPIKSKPPIPHQGFSDEVGYMTRFFAVLCNENGEVTDIRRDYIASVSDETAASYAHSVLEKRNTSGYYEGYRYTALDMNGKTFVIFLNSEKELQNVYSLLRITSVVAVCCLIVVFILVNALSRRAIAPYVRNIETQKKFITGASHELKTPLTAISTSADVLTFDLPDNEWVKNIKLQSARMSKLIANLITLSRLDEENPYPDKTTFSLTEAIWEISEPYAAVAKASGKEYVQHIENDITMFGDKRAIQQMVSILLDNAKKYSPPDGKIRLDVIKRQKKTEISVYNTCHIEHYENINRIFDRFYRLDETHSSRDSYGIGLSIAKAIVENHHGTIHAETHNGENLLVRIRF